MPIFVRSFAFLSPNVLQFLVDTFKIKLISTPEDDLKPILGQKNTIRARGF